MLEKLLEECEPIWGVSLEIVEELLRNLVSLQHVK